MKTRASRWGLLGIVMLTALIMCEVGLAGCNAILGNETGILALDGSTESGVACPAGQKSCAGSCVAVNDPAVGCSGECTACASPPNGQPGCALANDSYLCAIDKCNAQYDNCDDSGANGCETHITTRAHCGSCNGSCAQQFCERQGDSYVCSDSCDAPNISCGVDGGVIDCIDPKTDNANCGGCGKGCTVANGTSTCQDGGCSAPDCDPNYFLCGGVCQTATATACGASCAPCPTGMVCDVALGDKNYGTCVDTVCTPDDQHCGVRCKNDCTTSGESCFAGGCVCNNRDDNNCGCPSTNCSALGGPGAWTCNAAMSPPACACKGTVCPGSTTCCPSDMTCVGSVCAQCAAGSCPLDDGGCTNDLTTSPNCGSCGVTCMDDDQCCFSGGIVGGVRFNGGTPGGGVWSCSNNSGIDICHP